MHMQDMIQEHCAAPVCLDLNSFSPSLQDVHDDFARDERHTNGMMLTHDLVDLRRKASCDNHFGFANARFIVDLQFT